MPFVGGKRRGANTAASNSTAQAQAHDAAITKNDQREVAIFWDMENVQIPSWAKPADASKAIVRAVSHYGRIVDRRLYYDMSGDASGNLWSALDSSGFDLVNTPRRNQKETLDKKLIADVLTFAWDSAVRNDDCKPCVVLLTSDGDYAYTLSKLRDRGVMSVVMYGNDSSVANVLKASADIPLSFEKDVLSTIQNSEDNDTAASKGGFSSTDNARLLCQVVAQDLTKDTTHGTWILGSKVAMSFRTALLAAGAIDKSKTMDKTTKDEIKGIYRKAREVAIKNGWLVHGRKSLQGRLAGEIIAPPVTNTGSAAADGTCTTGTNDPQHWSLEDFLRVTLKGKAQLEKLTTAAANNNTEDSSVSPSNSPSNGGSSNCNLFIKNVPTNIRIKDLVQYLEQEFDVVVLKGYTKKQHPSAPFMFASVQVEAEAMADLLCQSRLKLHNRTLEVSHDRHVKAYVGPAEHHYERAKSKSMTTATPSQIKKQVSGGSSAAAGEGTTLSEQPQQSTKLFFKNVPLCNITDLVEFLEKEHNVTVLQANVQKGNPSSAFQFAHVKVATLQEADHLLKLSGSTTQLKFLNRVLSVNAELSDKKGYTGNSSDNPEEYYECPAEKNPVTKDDVLSLCKIVRAHFVQQEQQGAEGLPDGWFDGGLIADAFYTLVDKLETSKGYGCQKSDQAKERFKTARSEAADKKYIQVGRRRKEKNSSKTPEAVGWNCNAAKYSGEIYLRLTEAGTELLASLGPDSLDIDTRIVLKTNKSNKSTATETKNLFILGLPAGTDVRIFVSNLETTHNCSILRATLDPNKMKSCNAHVEMKSSQDAAKLLQKGSSSGITFAGKRLTVYNDLRIPSFAGSDLTRFYEASDNHPIPSTIVSVAHTTETCSVVSTSDNLYSETQSQMSTEDSQLECEDESLMCRVVYEQCKFTGGIESDNPDFSKWKAMGSAGSDFQNLLKGPSEESKSRFKIARENCISASLLEMGRRDLRSPDKEVVLVPFFSYGQGSSNASLSVDSYLRLTTKGILEAEKVPSLKGPRRTSKSKGNNMSLNKTPEREEKETSEGAEESREEEVTRDKNYIVNQSTDAGNTEASTAADTFSSSNLLFGDNLAQLYAQGAPKTSGFSFDSEFSDTNIIDASSPGRRPPEGMLFSAEIPCSPSLTQAFAPPADASDTSSRYEFVPSEDAKNGAEEPRDSALGRALPPATETSRLAMYQGLDASQEEAENPDLAPTDTSDLSPSEALDTASLFPTTTEYSGMDDADGTAGMEIQEYHHLAKGVVDLLWS